MAETTQANTAPAEVPKPKPRLLLKNFPHVPDGYVDELPEGELAALKANHPHHYEALQDAIDRFEHPEKYAQKKPTPPVEEPPESSADATRAKANKVGGTK